jgi:hypothetical protein
MSSVVRIAVPSTINRKSNYTLISDVELLVMNLVMNLVSTRGFMHLIECQV